MIQFRKANLKTHIQIYKKYEEGVYRNLVYAISY